MMDDTNAIKSQCVLLDANAWIKNLLLRTAHGSALLYAINRAGIKLALPEVVEDELIININKTAMKAIEEIEKRFRQIGSIVGSHKAYYLPKDAQISDAIKSRLLELDFLLLRAPFTLEHARSALRRVIEGRAPSSKKMQQFKDCAIWECALSLAKEHDIHLISNDGDFYQNKERTSLDATLSRECSDTAVNIIAYSSIELFLERLFKSVPALDKAQIAQDIYESVANRVVDTSAHYNFKPTGLNHFDIRAFFTEVPDVVAVNYSLYLDALDLNSDSIGERQDPTFSAFGKCRYELKKGKVLENDLKEVICEWRDFEGNKRTGKRFLEATIGMSILGTPTVPYRYEGEIPPGD